MSVAAPAPSPAAAERAEAPDHPKTRRRSAARAGASAPMLILGGSLVLIVLVLATVGPALSPYDPIAMAPSQRLLPPGSPGHLLGTDQVGRDELTRLMDGARQTLLIGAAPVLLSLLVGSTLGLLAGFYGRWADHLIMRGVDILFAFPAILLAIAIVAALGPGIGNTILAISIVEIPTVARIVRAPVLALREEEFVQAARVIGASDGRIIVRHIGRNLTSPLIVFASVEMGSMVIFGAGLSFLGLGAQAPQAEWGLMMAEGRDVLAVAPHVATLPGLAILLVVLGLSFLGDGLRDWLDPRSGS
jgi:peptide/nickel transport system permease protein